MEKDKFSRQVGAPISAQDAMKKINAFTEKYPDQTKSCFMGADRVIAWAKQLEANPDLAGISCKFGLREDGSLDIMFYPTMPNGNLVSVDSEEAKALGESDGAIGDNFTQQCPPFCVCPPDDPNCLSV